MIENKPDAPNHKCNKIPVLSNVLITSNNTTNINIETTTNNAQLYFTNDEPKHLNDNLINDDVNYPVLLLSIRSL